METLKLDVISGNRKENILIAANLLKQGKTVAIPTETVYGLAASAFDDNAIKNVFLAKGRPQDNPLIVHISDMEMLKTVATDIPDIAYKCAEKFWPGPFTMILKKTDKIAKSVSAGLDTVAVRMPSDNIAHDIIAACGIPLAAPSANLSGKPSPTTAKHVVDDLFGKIDGIVLGNDCKVGVESTVITLVGKPKLLRPGGITLESLKEIIPDIEVDKAVLCKLDGNHKVASPGMKYKHYAPNTETYLISGESNKFADYVNKQSNCVAVCFEEEKDLIKVKNTVYGKASDETTLAKNVFAVLRNCDTFGCDKIFIHAPSKSGVGLAVYNRLIRAAAFKVIEL
ncbi:MAG: threonylcarbamoyl-AMP synthase [Clostridia bacterium]|nr:threonylcarbamoyl-AMP synthase [Clostridia bacterium]